MSADPSAVARDLAPTGTLRASINLGNSVLAQGSSSAPSGVTVDIAREVADRLGVPRSWVLESARSGAMPCVRLGRYVRFDLADVEAWLESCKQPGRRIRLRSDNAAKAAEGGSK